MSYKKLVTKLSQFNSDASVIRKERFDTARTCMDNFLTGILTKCNTDDVSTQPVTLKRRRLFNAYTVKLSLLLSFLIR